MPIDWGLLVDEVLANAPGKAEKKGEKASEHPCSHSKSGNNGGVVGTKNKDQVIDYKGLIEGCSHVLTVPTIFEEGQGTEVFKNGNGMDFEPDGEGAKSGSAPEKKPPAPACLICANLTKPGLSSGYCKAARADLAPAYGPGHPLRRLPPDGGASCHAWAWNGLPPRPAPEVTSKAPARFAKSWHR